MDYDLVAAQTLKFAEEFQQLFAAEQAARVRAETANKELTRAYRATVGALAAALDLRDDATGHHSERVTAMALQFAQVVAPALAADPLLEYGFLLHDIGKIGVPDAILRKQGPLDARERAIVELHPEDGARILAGVPFLEGAAFDVVVAHHERWDGAGYPRGLAGDAIPLAARIFAVADSIDAMTHDRPYRRALPVAAAVEEILAGAGTQFDPDLATAFARGASERRERS